MSFLHCHTVPPPGVTVTSVTSAQVVYETPAQGRTTRVIAGYEVIRFGVPMIGEYENTGRGRTVTISPAVPGAQYRITAWALGGGNRSATPTVVHATTGEASEFCGVTLSIIIHDHYVLLSTKQTPPVQEASQSQGGSKMVLN